VKEDYIMKKLLITVAAGIMAIGLLANSPIPAPSAQARAAAQTARHEMKPAHTLHLSKKIQHKAHKKDAGTARTLVHHAQTPTQ
jgi:hypothetical protein